MPGAARTLWVATLAVVAAVAGCITRGDAAERGETELADATPPGVQSEAFARGSWTECSAYMGGLLPPRLEQRPPPGPEGWRRGTPYEYHLVLLTCGSVGFGGAAGRPASFVIEMATNFAVPAACAPPPGAWARELLHVWTNDPATADELARGGMSVTVTDITRRDAGPPESIAWRWGSSSVSELEYLLPARELAASSTYAMRLFFWNSTGVSHLDFAIDYKEGPTDVTPAQAARFSGDMQFPADPALVRGTYYGDAVTVTVERTAWPESSCGGVE